MADNRARLYSDIDVTLDKNTMDMTIVAINNVPNLQTDVIPDPTVTALIDKYSDLAAPLANQVIGTITTDILRDTPTAAGESALGDVIADAQLQATASAGLGDAVVAFMNPGGIRENFLFAASEAMEGDGNVTFGEAFAVQPFTNNLVTMTLTGQQIHDLLEEQFSNGNILQVSAGFSYTWNAAGAIGDRVDPADIVIAGGALNLAGDYRVTVNNFLAGGGDGFSVLTLGTDLLTGEIDLDALVTYFGANSPVAPGPQDRITRLN
jgi:5'-nucleotidase